MTFTAAQRILNLPPYLFADIDKSVRAAKEKGLDIISFGIGDPDLPAPPEVVEALAKAASDTNTHSYPDYEGMESFRTACADYMKNNCQVTVDANKQVVSLIGSKEGIAHLPLAIVNPGDVVLVPDPAYPVYANASMFAGGTVYRMPLQQENGFLPDLQAIDPEIAEKASLMFVNYPNNPTAAMATEEFYTALVAFAKQYNIVVAADAAYREVVLEGESPLSFLQIPGAMDVGIEFHSLSKIFNMTGFRIAFAAGNENIVQALGKVKTNMDSGPFDAIQYAGIHALENSWDYARQTFSTYKRRRDMLLEGLKKLGLNANCPQATFYLWAQLPDGIKSKEYASKLIDQLGIVVTPGVGFGEYGEGYVRFSLTVPEARMELALQRMKEI